MTLDALRHSKLLKRLASFKLAAVLMALLGMLSILAVAIPQRGYLGADFDRFVAEAPRLAGAVTALGLDRVYAGWPIVVLTVLLAVNLIACTLRRIVLRPRRDVGREHPEAGDTLAREVAGELERRGWSVSAVGPARVVARKGTSGFSGSVFMHVGFVVIILGAAVTALTTFRGEMVISEGQTVVDRRESYRSVAYEPRIGPAFSGARIAVDSTDVAYEQGLLVSAVARMRAIDPDGRVLERDVRVNRPLDASGKTYLLQDSGYAVRAIVRFKDVPASPIVVALAEETASGWKDTLELASSSGEKATLEMLATPVPLASPETLPAEKFLLRDPRLRLRVVYGGSTWEGELQPGASSADVGGLTVTFEGLGLWDRFLVRGEPARWITYVGFWLAIVGAAWRFAVPERRIRVELDSDRVTYAGVRSRPWPGLEASGDRDLACALGTMFSRDSRYTKEGPES